jgi:hypothetical protein
MLEERELENNLILGLCNSLIKKDTLTDHCVFINSIESGQVMSTSIKTAERAIVSCRTDDTRSVKELAEYFHDQDIRLSGVFGEHLPAEAFACFYGGEYFTEMTMIVHCLNRVNELSIVPGSFRVAVQLPIIFIVKSGTNLRLILRLLDSGLNFEKQTYLMKAGKNFKLSWRSV